MAKGRSVKSLDRRVRLATGGYKNKKGKIIGGTGLGSRVKSDYKKGLINVRITKSGAKIQATRKGKKVFSERLKRKG